MPFLYAVLLRTKLWFLILIAIPGLAADGWKLPLFSTDAALVYDATQKFAAPPDAALYIVDLKVVFRVDEAGKMSVTKQVVFRIPTEAGAKMLTQYSEMWLAWRQQRPVVRARVITPDKQGHQLDQATLTEANLKGVDDMYSDAKILQIPLPALNRDAVLEYEVAMADLETVMPGQRFVRYPLALPYPIHHVVVEVHGGTGLRAIARGFEKIERKETTEGDGRMVRFEAWDIGSHEATAALPPELPQGPEILFSSAASWQAVARWYAETTEPVMAGQNAAPPISDSERDATIRKILARIQEKVRFTGLELGMGAYVPRRPTETVTRGYGDCKDKSTLLASRLREAGIPAKLALLMPYPAPDVVAEMPGLEAFSHMIVYVPGARPLWIDPTSQYAPATRLPLVDQGRSALIVDAATTGLVHTPESTAEENQTIEELTVTLAAQGKASLSGTESYSGGAEEMLRAAFALMTTDTKTKVESTLKNGYQLEKITQFNVSTPAEVDHPFRVTYSGEGWALGKTEGETAEVDLPFRVTVLGLPETKEEGKTDSKKSRLEDLYLPGSFRAGQRTKVIPPAGFGLKQVPEIPVVDLGPVKLERKISVEPDNSVVLVDTVTSPRRRYTAEEGKQITAGLEKTAKRAAVHLVFIDHAQRMLTEGKEKEALALACERVKADPKSAVALERLAATLSATGANSAAIETCRQATKLDPNSAAAFAQLGDLLARDWTGRLYHSGMQYAEALEAFQHAMQLDPKDTNLTLKLSALYEYDARGLRFTDRAHMTEAVATLRKIEPEISQLGRINTLAEALLFSRQFAAVKSLSERDDRNVSWSYRVAALAMTNGVEAARNSFDRAQSTEQRAFVFKNAGAFLVLLQEYATAAALLREAAKDENDVQATEVDLLAPTLRRQETHFSENAPVALGQLLIYALLDPEDEESWKKLYVPEWRGMRLKSERQALLTILRGWRSMAGQILGWKSIADVAVSNGAFVAEGSDGTGYRVRMADPAGNGAMKTIVWIVKRGADYQVLGLATNWANAGGEALKEARSGDLEGASQWLDWVREEQSAPASADPLAGTAFARLWPAPKGSAEQVAVAAASLAARGLPYEDARPMLVEAQKEASGAYRDGIDLAILESYAVRGEFAIGLPEAVRLHAAYPDSDRGFSGLLEAYIDSGQMDAAAHLAEERLAKDPKSASGLRARSRVLLERRQYGDAGAAIREVTRTAKVTATDWNDLAWYALFTDSVDADVLEAANTATRLTQNRNASLIQTLGCVQALRGDTAAAHKSLYQYLDLAGDTDDAARLLHGLIMEQVGVTESAREDYQRLARPKKREATSSYALGQRRLASMAAR